MKHTGILLVLSMMWGKGNSTPYEITYLDPKKGIVLEEFGVGITYEKTWMAVTSVKLPDWEPVLEYLQYCDRTLLEVCSLRGEKAEARCRYWHKIILRDITDIKEQVAEIKGFSSKIRKRRGLIDLVGKVSKFLFGTMDHEDSVEIYKKIEQLEHESTENLQLMSKQMTLMKSNFDAVLTPIKTIKKEHEELRGIVNNFIAEYVNNTHKLEQEMRYVRVQGETSEIMLAVITHMQYTQKTLTHLFTLINSLQQHKLHPLLLRAEILENLYRNITSTTSLNTRLKDPAILNEIITVEHLLLNDRILVKIIIPFGKELEFKINKVYKYPVPAEHGNFALIDTRADFLLTNRRAQLIRQFTKESFAQRCKFLSTYTEENVYLCKEEDPLPVGPQLQDPCVSSLTLSNNDSISPQCPARILAYHPIILTKMNTPNNWLFSNPMAQLLQSHCDNGTQQTMIKETGILHLNSKCSFTLGPWELPVERAETVELKPNHADIPIPQLKFNIRPLPNIKTNITPMSAMMNLKEVDMDKAAQETADLAQEIHQTEIRRQQERQEKHVWINLGISTISAAGLVGLIIYIGTKARKQRKTQQKERTTCHTVTISAPIINPLPKIENQSPPMKRSDQIDDRHVSFKDTNYEEPPQEQAPSPPPHPPTLRRVESIKIPRHVRR